MTTRLNIEGIKFYTNLDKESSIKALTKFKEVKNSIVQKTNIDAESIFNLLNNPIKEEHKFVEISHEREKKEDITFNFSSLNSSEDEFWQAINKLEWCDRDERIYSRIQVLHNLTRREIDIVKIYIIKFITILDSVIGNREIFNNNTSSYKINYYSHIIGKGKDFYERILEDPSLADYMVNSFQPLWSYL